MGKGNKGGGGGGKTARKAADQAARDRAAKDAAAKAARDRAAKDAADKAAKGKAAKGVAAKAALAKSKASQAKAQLRSKPQASKAPVGVKQAAASVGSKLSKGEVKDLQRQGLSGRQIAKVADRVTVKNAQAQAAVDRTASPRPANTLSAKSGSRAVGKSNAGSKAAQAKEKALSVKQALSSVGSKLSKGEVKDLKQQGYSGRQIQRVASQTTVKNDKAQQAIDRISAGGGASTAGGGGMVKQALATVGNKVSKGELKDLRREGGYSLKQLNKLAGKVEFKPGAQKKLDKWDSKGASETPEPPQAISFFGGGTAGGTAAAASGGASASGGGSQPAAQSTGGSSNYGTADPTGWLSAELRAVDTFKPDLTPAVYNNYRPTDLSGQVRDAVGEANAFIDETMSRWRRRPPSPQGSATTPASLSLDYGDQTNDGWRLLHG